MGNSLLYALVVLIWGSTWIAVKYQVGPVAPEFSVAYRFLLAALIMFVWARLRAHRLRYDGKTHLWFLLLGILIFSTNFVLFYFAAHYVTSGLLAVIFSATVLANLGWGALFLGQRPSFMMLTGAATGVTGMVLVFWRELAEFDLEDGGTLALILGLFGMLSFSLGNIVSARLQRNRIAVVPSAAYGMLYGSIYMFGVAFLRGNPVTFDFSWLYVLSFIYLTVFGSVVTFGCYLALIGRIGAGPAGYSTVLFPIVALAISTVVENYVWTLTAFCGVGLTLLGNLLILSRPKVRAGSLPAKS